MKKWTKEEVLERALHHLSIKEWKAASLNAYNAARRNGWHEEATKHMGRLHQKWTEEAIFIEAKKYTTKSAWARNSPKSYDAAGRRNLRKTASLHMQDGNKFKVWTKKKILTEAKKFKTKKDWLSNSRNSYQAAKYHGLFEEATAHMISLGSRHRRCVYKIEIAGTDLIYVGLTYNVNKRFHEHLRSKRFSNIIKKYGKGSISIATLSDYIDRSEAALLEQKYITDLREQGFVLLNLVKGGGLGGSGEIKWTKESVLLDAKLYDNKTEWATRSAGAFYAARRDGYYQEAVAHMPKPALKWNMINIIEDAARYNTVAEWTKNSSSAVNTARVRDWFEIATKHMKKRNSWGKNNVLETALKYSNPSSWRNDHPYAYKKAREKGWLAEATAHMVRKHQNNYWTKVRVLNEALLHSNKTDWKNYSSGSYYAALRNGWFEEASAHLPKRAKSKKD